MNLSKKIALVISIPIVCQTIVIGLLLGVHAQSQSAIEKIKKVDAVLECLNQVNQDVDELMVLIAVKRITFSNMNDIAELKKLSRSIDAHVVQLNAASVDDASILATINKAQTIKTEMLSILMQSIKARYTHDFENGVNIPKVQLNVLIERLTKLVPELRWHEQRLAAVAGTMTGKLWLREEQVALFGGLVTIAISLVAGLVITRALTRRIERLQDNTFRIASRLELHSPETGTDELALLDRSFQRLARTLKEKERRETLFIDAAYDGIVALDKSLRITYSNASFTELTGYALNELNGQTFFSFFAQSTHSSLSHILEQAQKQEEKSVLNTQVLGKNSRSTDAVLSVQWLPTEAIYYCTVRDVSAERAAERTKNEIIEMVSHDLKTPLCTVDNVLTMLQEPCSEDKKQKYMSSAQRNVKRSIRLILDFLDIEKLEANSFNFSASNFQLSILWDGLNDAVIGIATKQLVSVDLPQGNEFIFADQESILRVLINLVSNAIAQSPPNATVRIRTRDLRTHCEVTVEDDGPGIEPEELQLLFERFYRKENAAGGTGLGLTICKHLVEQQGGKMNARAKSDDGKGAAFSFTVPVGSSDAARESERQVS